MSYKYDVIDLQRERERKTEWKVVFFCWVFLLIALITANISNGQKCIKNVDIINNHIHTYYMCCILFFFFARERRVYKSKRRMSSSSNDKVELLWLCLTPLRVSSHFFAFFSLFFLFFFWYSSSSMLIDHNLVILFRVPPIANSPSSFPLLMLGRVYAAAATSEEIECRFRMQQMVLCRGAGVLIVPLLPVYMYADCLSIYMYISAWYFMKFYISICIAAVTGVGCTARRRRPVIPAAKCSLHRLHKFKKSQSMLHYCCRAPSTPGRVVEEEKSIRRREER